MKSGGNTDIIYNMCKASEVMLTQDMAKNCHLNRVNKNHFSFTAHLQL